jgi:hypothetical protein
MTFKKQQTWKKPAQAEQPPAEQPQAQPSGGYGRGGYQQRRQGPPTFVIKESQKTGKPFAQISGRVAAQGRSGAICMIFPSKFEGTFAALTLGGWGRSAMIPVSADQIDIQGKTLKIDLGFIKIEVTGENTEELTQFLQYVSEMPREQGGFQGEQQPQPSEQKPSWRK